LKDYFGPKNITKLSYIDIGANVGKFYDVLSRDYSIERVIMVETGTSVIWIFEWKI